MPDRKRIGVLGATSVIGECLLPLLVNDGWDVVAFSRREAFVKKPGLDHVERLLLDDRLTRNESLYQERQQIPFWIILTPIFVLPDYFPMLSACGARRVVAVSSTSMFTKNRSSDPVEIKLAGDLARGEDLLIAWAKKEKLDFTILRPTLVYGLGRDKTVSVISSFIRRFSFFCIFGEAHGLRQPLHARDAASVCLAALCAPAAVNQCYNISGGETITYREMVCRIFSAMGRKPRLIAFPLRLFRLAVFILRAFPRFRHWSAAMAERMNQDLVFEHTEAARDLGFTPRPFHPGKEDLPDGRWD